MSYKIIDKKVQKHYFQFSMKFQGNPLKTCSFFFKGSGLMSLWPRKYLRMQKTKIGVTLFLICQNILFMHFRSLNFNFFCSVIDKFQTGNKVGTFLNYERRPQHICNLPNSLWLSAIAEAFPEAKCVFLCYMSFLKLF